MKKFIVFISILIIVFSLLGEGTETTDESGTNNTVLIYVDGVGWIYAESNDSGKDDEDGRPIL